MERILLISLALAAFCVAIKADQNDDYSSGIIPDRLSVWPKALEDYQELPGSRSPDGRYGFIYPRRNVVETISDPKLYLSRLRPFQILANVPVKYGNLCENTGSSYFVKWAPDSSDAVFYVGGKKGPFHIFAVSVKDHQHASLVDLEVPIRKLVQSSYDHSNAPRFNDYFDFIFIDEDYIRDSNNKPVEVDASWTPNDRRQVLVKCICTNDPKRLEKILWEVVFEGVWDINRACFVEHHFEQITPSRLPPY